MDAGLPEICRRRDLADAIAALEADHCRRRCGANARTCWSTWSGSASPPATRTTSRRALAGWDDDGPCTRDRPCAHAERGRRRFRQRHGRAWRGFRRHVRGRPGACRRRHRAGGAGGLRAAQSATGAAALLGIAVGVETMCRLSLVVPKAVHKAGFHPTAVFGAMGAAAGVGAALGLTATQIVDALGIAGSMAGGIIEYLAEGAWTKRMHAGLGGAIRPARGAAGARRLRRPAHRVRRRARPVPRLRPYDRRRL